VKEFKFAFPAEKTSRDTKKSSTLLAFILNNFPKALQKIPAPTRASFAINEDGKN
jgi:hypothetical protein